MAPINLLRTCTSVYLAHTSWPTPTDGHLGQDQLVEIVGLERLAGISLITLIMIFAVCFDFKNMPLFANGCYTSRKKNTILKTFTGNGSSFVLQVFPLILLQRFPILGFKHKKGTRFEKLVYEVHHTSYSIVIGWVF